MEADLRAELTARKLIAEQEVTTGVELGAVEEAVMESAIGDMLSSLGLHNSRDPTRAPTPTVASEAPSAAASGLGAAGQTQSEEEALEQQASHVARRAALMAMRRGESPAEVARASDDAFERAKEGLAGGKSMDEVTDAILPGARRVHASSADGGGTLAADEAAAAGGAGDDLVGFGTFASNLGGVPAPAYASAGGGQTHPTHPSPTPEEMRAAAQAIVRAKRGGGGSGASNDGGIQADFMEEDGADRAAEDSAAAEDLTAAEAAAAEEEAAVAEAIERMEGALAFGASMAEATACAIGGTAEESAAALVALQQAAATLENDETVDAEATARAILAASVVAAKTVGVGGSLETALKAGANASALVASGDETIEQAMAAAHEAAPRPPGWSLASWLNSLSFTAIISDAVLKRVRSAVPKGTPPADYERAFIARLGELDSAETVLALLKETPVLVKISEAICGHAKVLSEELAEAERANAEAERREWEREQERERELERERARRKRQAERERERLRDEAKERAQAERGDAARGGVGRAEGGGESGAAVRTEADDAGTTKADDGASAGAAEENGEAPPAEIRRAKTAAELNEEMQASGAFTLSYCTDAAVYWKGIAALTGKPTPLLERPIMSTMASEHRDQLDSEASFEVGNYGTVTNSRIEWLFVSDPEGGLAEVSLAIVISPREPICVAAAVAARMALSRCLSRCARSRTR